MANRHLALVVALLVFVHVSSHAVRRKERDQYDEIYDMWADLEDLDVEEPNSDLDEELPFGHRHRDTRGRPSSKGSGDPMAALGASGGPSMSFMTLKPEYGKNSKEETDLIAAQFKALLQTGHIETQIYTIEKNKILFVAESTAHTLKIKDFILERPETEVFEFQQQQFYPPGHKAAAGVSKNTKPKTKKV
eukprot:GILK01011082.1.p1 GENE.GILK01011082.1~~GILK01011082.1.p1  ORF type:complete len:191 (-),score=31.82 GILK01011082.1:83-655(-)